MNPLLSYLTDPIIEHVSGNLAWSIYLPIYRKSHQSPGWSSCAVISAGSPSTWGSLRCEWLCVGVGFSLSLTPTAASVSACYLSWRRSWLLVDIWNGAQVSRCEFLNKQGRLSACFWPLHERGGPENLMLCYQVDWVWVFLPSTEWLTQSRPDVTVHLLMEIQFMYDCSVCVCDTGASGVADRPGHQPPGQFPLHPGQQHCFTGKKNKIKSLQKTSPWLVPSNIEVYISENEAFLINLLFQASVKNCNRFPTRACLSFKKDCKFDFAFCFPMPKIKTATKLHVALHCVYCWPGVRKSAGAYSGRPAHPLPGSRHRPPPGKVGGGARHPGGRQGHCPVLPGHAVHRRNRWETHQPHPAGQSPEPVAWMSDSELQLIYFNPTNHLLVLRDSQVADKC